MFHLTTLAKRALERYREEGIASTLQASTRYVLRTLLEKYGNSGEVDGKYRQKIDLSSYPHPINEAEETVYDVILATDLRFPGGSSSSSAQEIAIQRDAGLKSGLYHLPSYKMRHRSSPARLIDEALRAGDADILNEHKGRLRTRLLLFRHPSILNPDGAELPDIEADQVGLIVNHPPVKFGQIEYLLPYAVRKLRVAYGREPRVYPIGPLVRAQINEIYDGTVPLADKDWVNVFDLSRFATDRKFPVNRPLRIGRHSRPNLEKWPENPHDIISAYPNEDDIEVHILGGADVPRKILGKLPPNWKVYEFGELDPVEFLRNIDVFVYFHHPGWVEAFGRTIVEAMAAGLPVILPPQFEPLLGDAGIYCMPEDVSAELMLLRDSDYYMRKSIMSQNTALRRFNPEVHLERIRALGRVEAGKKPC